MLPEFLLQENVVRENGAGPEIELGAVGGKVLLLTLGITRIVEQESLLVSIWGSSDGKEWGKVPIIAFPQKFYCGTYSQSIDMSDHSDIRYVRAEWTVNRWGRADSMPLFGFFLRAREVSVEATAGAVA